MLIKVIMFFMFSLALPSSDFVQKSNAGSVTESIIEIGAYNVRNDKDGDYLIDIYASNKQPIAGIQFELLGKDFEILDVSGGRAAHSGFSFYNGKGGIILAFSLKGDAVAPVDDVYKKVNPLFTIKINKSSDKEASVFNLKTLVSSSKGVALKSKFIPIEF